MKVALVGGGTLAQYFCAELPSFGHEIVVLTRTKKAVFDELGVEQREVDYASIESVTHGLQECEAVVSMILDYSMAFVEVNLNLLKAAQNAKCRRFIPSEFGGDLDKQPDQPAFYEANHEPVRKALKEQHDLEWTLLCVGWLSDYLLPLQNRLYSDDLGEAFPINVSEQTALIPGTGSEAFELTSACDLARAAGALLIAPSGSWEQHTYISGQTTCWNEVLEICKPRLPNLVVRYKTLGRMIHEVIKNESDESAIRAQYQIFSVSGAAYFGPEKINRHREKYFQGIHFRSLPEMLVAADNKKGTRHIV